MRKVYATRQKTIVSESASFTEKGKSKIEGHMYVPVCHTGFASSRGCGGMPPREKKLFLHPKN